MTKIFGASWRTFLTGLILSIGIAVEPIIESGAINWKAMGIAAFTAILSYLMKDKNVTGGTKSQPTVENPPTLVEKSKIEQPPANKNPLDK